MTQYDIIPATGQHVLELSRTMASADVEECWAAGRRRPMEALVGSMVASRDTRTALANGRVLCMFGVADVTYLGSYNMPWMLTARDLPLHARRFLRGSRAVIDGWRQEYPILRNWVDARNTRAIDWLRWLKFDILPAVPYGPDQLPFHPFEMLGEIVDERRHQEMHVC